MCVCMHLYTYHLINSNTVLNSARVGIEKLGDTAELYT